jgi:uncharacterized membrane protein
MNINEYFGMIIFILMGLTFIALVLIFLFMIYGGKTDKSSFKVKALKSVVTGRLLFLL